VIAVVLLLSEHIGNTGRIWSRRQAVLTVLPSLAQTTGTSLRWVAGPILRIF